MSQPTTPPAPAPQPAEPGTPAERMWRDMAQAHANFLAAQAAAHTAFLQSAASFLGQQAPQPAAPAPTFQPPAAAPMPVQTPAPVQQAPAPVYAPAPTYTPAPQPVAPAPTQPAPYANGHAASMPAPAAPARPAPEAMPSAAPVADAAGLVRAIVAEKTGYPEDMLEADMDLEGELGVDSIKQVEILSTLRERMPDLPEIAPEKLAELRTISAIASMIGGAASGPKPAPAPAAPAYANGHANGYANGHAADVPAAANGALSADAVRAVIAEKTGYPEDMLEDDMDLEGELGVDSIKQVEILSALRERHPGLPEVEPEAISELRTIRSIAAFFA